MTHDEQRKRIYELECALGKAVKLAEQGRDQLAVCIHNNSRISEINAVLITGIQSYMQSMDKKYLINAIDLARENAKFKRP